MPPRYPHLVAAILLLLTAGVTMAQESAAVPPLALCIGEEGEPPETDAPSSLSSCGGAAVVHPPPQAAAEAGYVDCVTPGAASLDARCVAGGADGAAVVAARSLDEDGGRADDDLPPSSVSFPPGDTGAVLAACPDIPLLPDALGTEGNTDTGGLPGQAELDAAAEQVKKKKKRREREREHAFFFFLFFRNSPRVFPTSNLLPHFLFSLPPRVPFP